VRTLNAITTRLASACPEPVSLERKQNFFSEEVAALIGSFQRLRRSALEYGLVTGTVSLFSWQPPRGGGYTVGNSTASAVLPDLIPGKPKFPASGFPEIIRAKHKLRILWDLQHGSSRFGEIRRRLHLEGADTKLVAARVLSRELKSLVELRFVHRKAYNEIPPRVEYRLTSLGRSLLPVIAKILDWGTRHPTSSSVARITSLKGTSKVETGRMRSGQHCKTLTEVRSETPGAYQDYAKGRFYGTKATEESLRRAIVYFEQAIEKDPLYALAYAGLSDAYAMLAFFNLAPPQEVLPKARQTALKALEIDDGLTEAHISLAGVMKVYDWDWRGAECEYRRALELNPNHPEAHRRYADFLSAMGRHPEALNENQKAQELDPFSCAASMEGAWNLYMAREYRAAAQQAFKTLRMEPNYAPAYFALALAYERMGKSKEAISAFDKTRSISGSNPATIAGLGHALGRAGQKAEARAFLKELQVISKRRYVSPYCFALVHEGLGEKDRALAWLEEAVATHDVWLVWLKADPRFDALRGERCFQNLLGRVGLPA
jgi:DNA-binding HxlR family transcriptional regulator/tetratricopeptide (TPR) repeat protein